MIIVIIVNFWILLYTTIQTYGALVHTIIRLSNQFSPKVSLAKVAYNIVYTYAVIFKGLTYILWKASLNRSSQFNFL